jgi:signal transduction histidine kinase
MNDDSSKDSPVRRSTDESLRSEREKTDRALAEGQGAVEEDADRVVERARDHADAVLLAARDKADTWLDQFPDVDASRSVIAKERVLEDDVLRQERATADETLLQQRLENARLLQALLPLERDTTDRYLLSERVHSDDAVSRRDEFLGIVSHDVRDLLGGIVMTAGLMSKRAPAGEDGAETRRAAERIQRYVARMNRLIGDLVDVASIDAGKLALSPARGDLTALVAEAVDTFETTALAKGLTLTMELAERPLLAEFDYERMLQVMANLLTNAFKFTPAGGSVRVRCEHVDRRPTVAVTDTGCGIPAASLSTIFERFHQVGEKDRRGLGLGLYISRCVVEAHGGTIWAESVVNEGATVRFVLPAPDERRHSS